jgi:hypothetical protein
MEGREELKSPQTVDGVGEGSQALLFKTFGSKNLIVFVWV